MLEPAELPPRLRIEGRRLIKPNGREWRGRGVSFGSFGEDVPEDVPAVAALGCSVVRIPLRWWGLHGEPGIDSREDRAYAFLRRSNWRAWLDLIVAVSAAGLWVVPAIDSNCGQSGIQDVETMRYCDPYGVFGAVGRNFWTDKPMRALFATVWQHVAAYLRTIPRIAFLEIQPEPLSGRDERHAKPCADFYRYLADAIREADPDTPLLSGPRNAYDIRLCREAHLPERGDMVYTGNLLNQWVRDPGKFDEGLAELVAMRDEYDVPVWVQQVGRKSEDDADLSAMQHALEAMNAAEVGFAWWQYKQNTSTPDSYALHYKGSGGTWVAKTNELDCLAAAMN